MNEELAALPPLTRLLFAGLWTIADRDGRLEDRPGRIKAELLAYEKCGIAATHKMLQDLAEKGFILRYEANGSKYVAIPSWKKHQNPHQKEAVSAIPAPDQHRTLTVLAPVQHGKGTEQAVPTTTSASNHLNPSPATTTEEQQSLGPNGMLDPTKEPTFPATSRYIKQRFPATGDELIRALVTKAVQEVIGAGQRPELVTDDVLLEAVRQCTTQKQHSAALYLTTVPTWIRNKATEEAYGE